MDLDKLISDAKRGNKDAYDRLLKAHRPALEDFARQFTGRLPAGATADDLIRETGERGWLRVRQVGSPASVEGWFRSLMEVIANKAARNGGFRPLAGRARIPGLPGTRPRGRPRKNPANGTMPDPRAAPRTSSTGLPELARLVQAVLDSYPTDAERAQLTESDRAYLRGRFVEGVPYAELGRREDITAAAAREHCERALQRLVAVMLARDAKADPPAKAVTEEK